MTRFNHGLASPRSLTAAIAMAAVLVILGVSPAFAQADPCKNFDWRGQFQDDQAALLATVPLHVDDIVAALSPGGALQNYILPHGFADVLGNGLVLAHRDSSLIGRPESFLLYAGNPAATVAQSTNAGLPKNPYTFVGWGYLVDYYTSPTSPQAPVQTVAGFAKCVPAQEWFIHESAYHLLDGGLLLTPCALTPAQCALQAVGLLPPPPPPPNALFWHPRAWDLHVWINLCGHPRIGLYNQHPDGRLISGAGYSGPTGSFFFPPITEKSLIKKGIEMSPGPVCSPNEL